MIGHAVGQGDALARDLSVQAQAGLGGVVAGGHAQDGALGIAQPGGSGLLGGSGFLSGSGLLGGGGLLGLFLRLGSGVLIHINLVAAAGEQRDRHGQHQQQRNQHFPVLHNDPP